MACACGGDNTEVAEYEVRLPNGELVVIKGKAAAEMLIQERGGGSIVKKR